MWPALLDMTKEECVQSLRNLELEAYANLISALRAQGPLNPDKRKLLKDTGQVLNISQDRHKAEIRRAINDERLNTVAYHVTGLTDSLDDWAMEGRRTVPLLPRMAPQTVYSALADETADEANSTNRQLPAPALTERKRAPTQPPQIVTPDKSASFRIPDLPIKSEEPKKRKLSSLCTENSSLAQHLLGPSSSKVGRSQQMIRQRAKMLMKEMGKKPSPPAKHPYPLQVPQNGPKFGEETIEQIQNEINSYTPQKTVEVMTTSPSFTSNENQAPAQRAKLITPPKVGSFKPVPVTTVTTTPGPSNNGDPQKLLKMCAPVRKPVKATPLAQKLVMVSNAQTIPNTSILQKTLSIPLVKNLNMKNLEKFKIVTTASSQLAAGVNSLNSFKHKVVTVKTNPKKVIPLSQLLGTKGGIKVLPIGGKIVGKSTITTTSSQPVYIVNTMVGAPPQKSTLVQSVQQNHEVLDTQSHQARENGKSSVLSDILKASGVTAEDYDSQIEGFRIPNHNHSFEGDVDVHSSDAVREEPEGPQFDGSNSYVVLSEGVDYVEGDTEVDHIVMESEVVVPHVAETALANVGEVGNN